MNILPWIPILVCGLSALAGHSTSHKWEYEENGDEDDDNSVYFDDDSHALSSFLELQEWWDDFKVGSNYPLYGMFLAAESDEQVLQMLASSREELGAMAGKSCCLIYFRDLQEARELKPRDYKDHARKSYYLADLLGITYQQMPCAAFFEDFTSGNVVSVYVGSQTPKEILGTMKELFSYIRDAAQEYSNLYVDMKDLQVQLRNSDPASQEKLGNRLREISERLKHKTSPYEAIRKFRRAREYRALKGKVQDAVQEVGWTVVKEIVKTLVPIP